MGPIQKPVRLAILGSKGIPARYGGFETFAENIATRLVLRGIEVTVYCERGNGQAVPYYKGIRLVHLPAPSLGPLKTILFDLLCLWHARKPHDVVYMLGYGTSLFCLIPRLCGTLIWINMDGIEWKRSKWNKLARFWLRTMESIAVRVAHRIIADARGIRAFLERRYKHLPECSVIAYGAPVVKAPSEALLSSWGLEKDSYYLVVCRLEPENHVVEIMSGFLASETEKKLVIVGNYLSHGEYVRTLTRMQGPRVLLLGTVYELEKLQALRAHCFAYFHGHSVGGTNPSLLEALGCGNAVIAHDNPFNREVAGDAAVFFQEPSEIPEHIRNMESSPHMRDRMKGSARRIVAEKYTWEKITSQYLAIL